MKRIFLDTNILLDVLLERHPNCYPAQQVWSLSERKKVRAAVSAISINNVFFIVKKLSSLQKAYESVGAVVDIFEVIDLKVRTIQKAIEKQAADFEDTLQYFSALQFKAHALLTRDPTGFSDSKIPVMDCPQYLALFQSL